MQIKIVIPARELVQVITFIHPTVSFQQPNKRGDMQPSDGLPDVDHSWMIKRSHLNIREEIGKGAFGTVYKADFFGIDVAVKQICAMEVSDPMEQIFVEREIAVLKYAR
jgi:serine/threonine protein kinase